MKFNKSERIKEIIIKCKELADENLRLNNKNEEYKASINSLYGKLETYERIWKNYNLRKFYSLNNEFIGRIEIEYEMRKIFYDFCKYEIDNDFLIVFAKEKLYYFKKEKVDNFLIKYYKEGEQSDEVGKEKTII